MTNSRIIICHGSFPKSLFQLGFPHKLHEFTVKIVKIVTQKLRQFTVFFLKLIKSLFHAFPEEMRKIAISHNYYLYVKKKTTTNNLKNITQEIRQIITDGP